MKPTLSEVLQFIEKSDPQTLRSVKGAVELKEKNSGQVIPNFDLSRLTPCHS